MAWCRPAEPLQQHNWHLAAVGPNPGLAVARPSLFLLGVSLHAGRPLAWSCLQIDTCKQVLLAEEVYTNSS